MNQFRDIFPQQVERKRRKALGAFFVRLVREKRLGVLGGVITLIMIFLALFADVLAPYGIDEMRILDRFATPSSNHLLGGDQVGRDILTRLIYGARISMVVGLAGTSITIVIASIIGVPSGYFGGKFDIIVQRFVDALLAFPGLLVLLTLLSIVGPGMSQIILVLGILSGVYSSRIVRSAVIGIKEDDYFLATRAIGCPTTRTVMRHIIPNIMAPIIIIFSISIGNIILEEASLSFLGFGLPPEVPSWGGMLSWEGRRYMEIKPELALYPGLCLAVVIFGVNMFGDAVRDLLDPRLRGG